MKNVFFALLLIKYFIYFICFIATKKLIGLVSLQPSGGCWFFFWGLTFKQVMPWNDPYLFVLHTQYVKLQFKIKRKECVY